MLRTIEVRWFFPGKIPSEVADWFQSAAPGWIFEPPRTDYYLKLPMRIDLGIKIRQGRLETKERQLAYGPRSLHTGVAGQLESWLKWGFDLGIGDFEPTIPDDAWLPITKERWLISTIFDGQDLEFRGGKINTGEVGCEIELSNLVANNLKWWTIAFEASNSVNQGTRVISEVSKRFFDPPPPTEFAISSSYGYPAFIERLG